ncbi:ANTAR domain-containing protein [Streptomyces daliensis]
MQARRLARALSALAEAPEEEGALPSLLVQHGMTLLDAAAAGALLTLPGGRITDAAVSCPCARELQDLQIRHERGPGWDLCFTGTLLPQTDLRQEDCRNRWPAFTAAALAGGYAAVTAVPLQRGRRLLGSLTLLHHQQGTVDADGLEICRSLAQAAALALSLREESNRAAQLQGALDSRTVIEQAKGVLSERHRCPPDHAFTLLREHARRNQRRLHELARQVVIEAAESPASPLLGPRHPPDSSSARGVGTPE